MKCGPSCYKGFGCEGVLAHPSVQAHGHVRMSLLMCAWTYACTCKEPIIGAVPVLWGFKRSLDLLK